MIYLPCRPIFQETTSPDFSAFPACIKPDAADKFENKNIMKSCTQLDQLLGFTVIIILLAVGCGQQPAPNKQPDENTGGKSPNITSIPAANAPTPKAPHVRVPTPTSKSMPQKTSMAEVAKHLDFGGSSFTYQSSEGMGGILEGLFALGETMMLAERAEPEAVAVLKVIRDIYAESGIKDISGTGSSSFVMETGITRNAMMAHHWPGKGKGFLWKLLGGPAHELEGLKLMPVNTSVAVHGDLDVAAGWAWVKAFIGRQPKWARELDSALAEMENDNVPIDEILESLGGEVGVSVVLNPDKTIKFPAGGEFEDDGQGGVRFVQETIDLPEPGLVMAVKVKNDLLLQMIGSLLEAQGAESTKVNGVELMTLKPPPGEETPFPLSPTVMKSGDYLIFTSTKELAKEVIDTQSGKSTGLAGTADFQKVTDGLELKGNHLFYLSPLVRALGLKLVEDALAKEREFQNPQARAGMMKFIGIFADYLSHQVLLVKRLPNGLLMDNRTTGRGLLMSGGGGTSTVATVGVLASMLLPALAKAKAKANVIKSVNHAKQLGIGLIVHAQDNDDKLPDADKWCDMIQREVDSPRVFVSPQDSMAQARAEAGQKVSSYAFNKALSGKNLNEVDPGTVILFETDLGWNGSGGHKEALESIEFSNGRTIAVGTMDGTVRQISSPDELRRLRWDP